jgi:[glutamine synthetase] adenylyltransferase / [glutamine synthetase]-adenylyl-L-tyrosine phosphorylase
MLTVQQCADRLPGLDPALIEQHLVRLDARYFERFGDDEVLGHLRLLAAVGPGAPAALEVRALPGGEVACTVLAFDHPGAFSLIVGIVAALGLDITAGDIFTWAPPGPRGPRTLELRRRRLVDCFTGRVPAGARGRAWEAAVQARLTEVFAGLERGGDAAARSRTTVSELAASALGRVRQAREPVLYPVQIEVDEIPGGRARMRVISQDTPFFLYTFSTALSLQGVSIEHVTIRTEQGRIEDAFEIVDPSGAPITDPARLDRIKLSVLLTKQFTTFLENAPDPLAALLRFEQMVKDLLALPTQGRWLELLSDQGVLRELAQLLGASTFLWEDFVRLQYEELLPLLSPDLSAGGLVPALDTLPSRLAAALDGADEPGMFERRLNEFKDREIYLYDLDHILSARSPGTHPGAAGAADLETFGSDFLTLSKRLTALAEVVVDAAAAFAYRALAARHGTPLTVAGLPVRYAVLGLGKMGGAALGYASDIEILLVYSDSGSTAGPAVVENGEFFDSLAREVAQLVHAKREGIFHIDLRLRPYGASGPMGCSLESFCTYYAQGGPAHSYERLALVRLRAVGGDRTLGRQVERLRDEMVFSARAIDLVELRELRARQVQEKTTPSSLNAKFSPGALVDLEYAVQILQVQHGTEEPRLRTPRIHEALDALASIGVLGQGEATDLVSDYRFFRRLINGLRMLRGSAKDLVLPGLASTEYLHLARRMGYEPDAQITPAQKLHLDFEAHTASVRAFVERHFGRDSLPGARAATVADVVLSDAVPADLAQRALAARGFADPARAVDNLRLIAGEAEQRTLFARLAVLACDILSLRPDPDMALNNWERYLRALPDPRAHLRGMLSQPMMLEILLSIFSASQFLADTLVREPSLLESIGKPAVVNAARGAEEIRGELGALGRDCADREEWRNVIRRYRRREILRIAARDICLGVPTQSIMEEISDLADGIIAAALDYLRAAPGTAAAPAFCVIAFGKLGGRELNYSSDIDLLGLFASEAGEEAEGAAAALMEGIRADLSTHTVEGYAYRVDLRLRPYGSSGQLVYPMDALAAYYRDAAAPWELQALLKARPAAGNPAVGAAFLEAARVLLTAPRERAEVAESIDRLRKEARRALSRSILSTTTDIKTGLGGLRDVEFLAQGLLLVHAHESPGLLRGATVPALQALADAGILPAAEAGRLVDDYLFLRRVEHFLQIYEDRQTHSLPRDPAQLRALARLMLGSGAGEAELNRALEERFQRIQESWRSFAGGA